MPDAREYPSVLASAEAAVKRGDYATAEALLREGVPLQEAALGAAHPDVASSLNNLAVICESTGRLDEAEQLFRRAFAVATAAAARPGAEHILATSRQNLHDFCKEHGRPFEDETAPPWDLSDDVTPAQPAGLPWPPTAASAPQAPAPGARDAAPAVSAPAPPPPARESAPPRAARAPAPPRPPVPPAPGRSAGSGRLVAGVAALALLAAVVGWRWRSLDPVATRAPEVSSPVTAAPPEPTVPPGAAAPDAALPTERDQAPAVDVAPERPATPQPPAAPPAAPAAPEPAAPPTPAASGGLRVVSTALCASLDTGTRPWRCAPIDTPATPGRVSFVTRIASPRTVRLQHRWSCDGEVRQTVRLSAAASPVEGYRTFSRQTVTPGAWTVAVLDATGAVLDEVRFEVGAR